MTSMTALEMQREPADLRRAVQRDGEVVALTFHGKPYGYVVPADQWHKLTTDDTNQHNEQEEVSLT